MVGAAVTAAVVGACLLLSLHPPMPRHSSRFNLRFALGWLFAGVPHLALVWLVPATWSTITHPRATVPGWWVVVALVAVNVALIVALLIRMRRTRPALAAAFGEVFGPGSAPPTTPPPWWRIVLCPLVSWRPDVERTANVRYGPSRRGHRLDVYTSRRHGRHRDTDRPAPVLVYLHPGGFVMGSKRWGAHPLIHRLAAAGWVCVTADYRLRRVGYADQLADAHAAVTWARDHARELGGDHDAVFVAGGSAGAHLAATAALDGAPVRGVIGFYGYYGGVGRSDDGPSSPAALAHAGAPPFLLVSGSVDTLVLPRDVRAFARTLDAASAQPVVHAALPGAHHNFDFFHSLRFHRVGDAVVHFAELVLTGTVSDPSTTVRHRAPTRQ